MAKKSRLGRRASDSVIKPSDLQQHASALDQLQSVRTYIITDVFARLVEDFARDQVLPSEERSSALNSLLLVIIECLKELEFRSPRAAPEYWKNRDRKSNETPFEFVRRVYSEFVGRGLSKADIRRLDYPLYRAILNPHWAQAPGAAEVLADLPTKKSLDDEGLRRLPNGLTAVQLLDLLPPKVRDQLRLLEIKRKRSGQ